MALHPLHTALANLRVQSRWPDQEEFAYQMGLSLGGYRKYETGERIPSHEVLGRIIEKTAIPKPAADALANLRNEAKAQQVGIPSCQTQAVDCEALAKRIRSEVVYVLKQTGIEVKEATKGVVEKRIAMILRSVLGV